jgi:hypothetical protein
MVAVVRLEHVVTGPKGNETGASYSSEVSERLEIARHRAVGTPAGQPHTSDTTRLLDQEAEAGIIQNLQPVWFRPAGDAAAAKDLASLEPLQEWEGYVISVDPEQFTARLVDVTAGQRVDEEVAEFPLSDLSDDNRVLLKEGAIFRWVIGYLRSPGGNKRRVSEVTFRRLPAWTKKDLESARSKATKLAREIAWE